MLASAALAAVETQAAQGTTDPLSGRVAESAVALELVDDWSRVVAFAQRPARIVSLAPHATELLVASGAASQLVAVDRNSDYPPEVRALPRLSSFPQPDAERLLALSPDLVVVWGPGIQRSQLEQLSSLGMKVFVSDPQRLEDIGSSLRRFAVLSEAPAEGRALADEFDRRLIEIRSEYATRAPVRVFVQIWSNPVISVADRGVIGDAIRSCGGLNVFGGAPVAAPRLDPEAVLAAQPALVVATDGMASAQRWTERGLVEPSGRARFVAFDASTLERPGPRAIAALESLCVEIDATRRSVR